MPISSYMKIVFLLIILIITISCQLMNSSKTKSLREVSGIFDKSEDKESIFNSFKLNSDFSWILIPNALDLTSVEIFDKEVECIGKNIVEINNEKKTIFYVSNNSTIKCKSITSKIVDISYNYYNQQIGNLNDDQVKSLEKILTSKEFKNNTRKTLKDLGLYSLFTRKTSSEDLKKYKYNKGDLIDLKIWPQLRDANCPDETCSYKANISGLNNVDLRNEFKGMNQLKYPEMKPFLFFCGGRYAAGRVLFKADEGQSLEYKIDENGFSCDTNDFHLNDKQIEYQVLVTHISMEKVQSLLLGKESELLKLKNIEVKNNIINHISEVEQLNKLISNYFNKNNKVEQKEGHLELWWEPFKTCRKNKNCHKYEYILTSIKLIYTAEQRVINIPFELSSFRSPFESEEIPKAVVNKICPENFSSIIETKHFQAGEKELESCQLNETSMNGQRYLNRWLLVTKPKEVELNEQTLYIESFEKILAPDESVLEADPMKSGKIFFDVYKKTMGERKLPFTRSRVIETSN